MKMTTQKVKNKDLTGFNFYITKGQNEFDASAFELAYDVNLTEKNVNFVNSKFSDLKDGEILLVNFKN